MDLETLLSLPDWWQLALFLSAWAALTASLELARRYVSDRIDQQETG